MFHGILIGLSIGFVVGFLVGAVGMWIYKAKAIMAGEKYLAQVKSLVTKL